MHKYRRTGLVKSQRRGPGRSRGVPFSPPFIIASSAATCSNERAGHAGHPLLLSTGRRRSFLLPRSTLSPLLCWARIFVSVLGDLPPLNPFRREACFVLTNIIRLAKWKREASSLMTPCGTVHFAKLHTPVNYPGINRTTCNVILGMLHQRRTIITIAESTTQTPT